jgi:transposase
MDLEQDAIDVKELKIQKNKLKQKERLEKFIKNETNDEKNKRLKLQLQRENSLLKQKANKELKKQKALEKGKIFIDRTLKDNAGKSKHIRVYFDIEQKKTIKKWLGVTRFIYNKCLEIIKSNSNWSIKYLREKIINNANYKNKNQWMLEYNYDLRDEALSDLLKNIKSNKAKGKKFDIHFKSRKEEYIKGASLSILAKHWNHKKGFFSNIYNTNKIKSNEKLPDILMYTSRLLKTATNKYFISLPLPLNENQVDVKEQNVIFIDPGSKCFLTGYDPSGKIIVWGENDIGRIARLLHYKRKLQSKKSLKDFSSKKKRKYRLAELRIGEKISNLIVDLHKKLAKWLCENYTKIYIPRLNFHKMKKLHSKEKAKLASLSHCAFVDRLIWKSREYKCNIYEVQEDYTSKTCSNCGFLKQNLKGRIYNCDACNNVFDRDVNASKNIMLKYLTERA